ncbi:MotA/TolQ/ExbB proton channel family protein [Stratiformator vulcanicus]|uniref:Biopolymer transport protein ExbB n=1 Tax=Stratiformator vulcanicus TaxID=2527980 RepID=A0A517R1N4_9PLAN|nr:MotA/TolQ/ExbB proton channel family protein [Stratiformator vulcanicus]QDT37770.1 Biopolymer transport protein ExbB [Stratiformator vulcanicus]
MNQQIFDIAATVIYTAMAAVAVYGVFVVVLLIRRIGQKQFRNAAQGDAFLEEITEHLRRREYEAVVEKCDRPPYWSKAVPQLMMMATTNRGTPLPKLKRNLAEKFERDVLADLEYRTSWITTIVKTAPMLGLLGTVVGMIAAFGKIASMQQQGATNPADLAQDISFALATTAVGLSIAIPLVLAGNVLQVKIGKLQDSVQDYLGRFLDEFAESIGTGGGPS